MHFLVIVSGCNLMQMKERNLRQFIVPRIIAAWHNSFFLLFPHSNICFHSQCFFLLWFLFLSLFADKIKYIVTLLPRTVTLSGDAKTRGSSILLTHCRLPLILHIQTLKQKFWLKVEKYSRCQLYVSCR